MVVRWTVSVYNMVRCEEESLTEVWARGGGVKLYAVLGWPFKIGLVQVISLTKFVLRSGVVFT